MVVRAAVVVLPAVLAALVLAACGTPSPQGEPAAPTTSSHATPTVTAPPSSAPAASTSGMIGAIAVQGRWTSPKCGARGYVRNLELGDDFRFKAEDRVSPCPPGVSCVWSGIVNRQGIWSLEGNKLTLATDKDRNPPKQGGAWPGSLEYPGAELVEVQGDERCSYTKQ